jgi:hypothetical protein
MTDREALRALPSNTPDYHLRQAGHLRALADASTTRALKERLLRDPSGGARLRGYRWTCADAFECL